MSRLDVVLLNKISPIPELPRLIDPTHSDVWHSLLKAFAKGQWSSDIPPLTVIDIKDNDLILIDGRTRRLAAIQMNVKYAHVHKVYPESDNFLLDVFSKTIAAHPELTPIETALWMNYITMFMPYIPIKMPYDAFSYSDAACFCRHYSIAKAKKLCLLSIEKQIQIISNSARI